MSVVRRLLSFSLIQLLIEAGILLLLIGVEPVVIYTLHIPTFVYKGSSITASTLTVILAFAVLIVGGTFLEHRSLPDIGLDWHRIGPDLPLGFVYAACLFSIITGIMALAGWYRVTSVAPGNAIPGILLRWLWIFFSGAVLEEVLFRGIIFRLAERALGSWLALLLSALFFGASHLQNPHATLVGALAIALTAGVVAGLIYILTRSLWLIIALHLGWNYFEATVFGNSTSGKSVESVLHSSLVGPTVWTGGAFGPEAGLLVVIVSLAIAIPLLIVAIRGKKYITPRWMQPAHGALSGEGHRLNDISPERG